MILIRKISAEGRDLHSNCHRYRFRYGYIDLDLDIDLDIDTYLEIDIDLDLDTDIDIDSRFYSYLTTHNGPLIALFSQRPVSSF